MTSRCIRQSAHVDELKAMMQRVLNMLLSALRCLLARLLPVFKTSETSGRSEVSQKSRPRQDPAATTRPCVLDDLRVPSISLELVLPFGHRTYPESGYVGVPITAKAHVLQSYSDPTCLGIVLGLAAPTRSKWKSRIHQMSDPVPLMSPIAAARKLRPQSQDAFQTALTSQNPLFCRFLI